MMGLRMGRCRGGGVAHRRVHVDERVGDVAHQPDPAVPRQRRRRRREAQLGQPSDALRREQQPVLQVAAQHEGVDEAGPVGVEAEAEQWHQVWVAARAEELDLPEELGLARGAFAPLDRHLHTASKQVA